MTFLYFQGFKKKHKKDESGGKKNFFDKSGDSGYHSKWDHFDSYHESSLEGSNQGKSHKVSDVKQLLNSIFQM